jgi:hypothetical protein
VEQDHGILFGSRAAGPEQLFEDVGGLPVGEFAPEVVILVMLTLERPS